MEDTRLFKGYVDGYLKYAFPLHCVTEIIARNNGSMLVRYCDESKEENKDNHTTIEIEVDYITM